MLKLLIFGFTALMSYLWINEGLPVQGIWVTLALIVWHVYKYIWPFVGNINNRNKRNKFLQFYQTLSKAEKNAASTLWEWDQIIIKGGINPSNNEFTRGLNEENLFVIYNNLPTDYESLRNMLKKEVKKVNKNLEGDRKRRAENAAKKQKKLEIEAQRREEATEKRKQYLTDLYGAKDTQKILKKQVWQGMSQEMLKESLGRPVKKREQIHKQTIKDSLFYKPRKTKLGTEMPTFRVDLENKRVVGWKDLDPN